MPVAKLLLAPLPQEVGLQQYLAPNISVPVETIDLGAVMDFPGVPELKHAGRQSQCLAAIGAALRNEDEDHREAQRTHQRVARQRDDGPQGVRAAPVEGPAMLEVE